MNSVRIQSSSGPQFPTFGLNTERMRENADQNNSAYGHFLRSENLSFSTIKWDKERCYAQVARGNISKISN